MKFFITSEFRESCVPQLNFGGHDTNCSIRGADCSVVLGNTVLTAQDQEDCWSFTPDAYFSCMENKCLMPTGIDIGLFTNVPSMNIEMHMGGVHPIVLDIEQKLQAKGFFTLTPDQTFGYKTLDAIKAFQTANKLPATGILDSQTINLLIK